MLWLLTQSLTYAHQVTQAAASLLSSDWPLMSMIDKQVGV